MLSFFRNKALIAPAQGIHTHLNESADEVAQTIAKHGRTPTQLAYDCGVLGARTVAAHCVHLTKEEIDLFAKTGTVRRLTRGCIVSAERRSVGLAQPFFERKIGKRYSSKSSSSAIAQLTHCSYSHSLS